MAKKTKIVETVSAATPATPAAPAAAVEAKAEKEARAKNDKFVRVMDQGKGKVPTVKLPPQAALIANTLEAAGEGGLTRAALIEALTPTLVTRQPVGRIVSYYQKLLVSSGVAEIVAA